MVSKLRAERISQRIREELSQMLLMEISDPRLVGLSVTDVTIDRELAYAEVFISALEGSERWSEIKEGLDSANGFLRHELAQRIDLRAFPRLRFRWDSTFERVERIEKLFHQIEAEDVQRVPSPDEAAPPAGDEDDQPVEDNRGEPTDGR